MSYEDLTTCKILRKETVSNNYLLLSMILADGPSSTGWSVEKLDPNTAQNHPAKIQIEKLRLYSWII